MVGLGAGALLLAGGTAFMIATNRPPHPPKAGNVDTTSRIVTPPTGGNQATDTTPTVVKHQKPPARRDSSHVVVTPPTDALEKPEVTLERLVKLASQDKTQPAQAALALYDSLYPRLDARGRAEALYYRGYSLGTLKRQPEACAVVREDSAKYAAGTDVERAVNAFLGACP
jgi:hypothetical protein